jgi:hypothetical protein
MKVRINGCKVNLTTLSQTELEELIVATDARLQDIQFDLALLEDELYRRQDGPDFRVVK